MEVACEANYWTYINTETMIYSARGPAIGLSTFSWMDMSTLLEVIGNTLLVSRQVMKRKRLKLLIAIVCRILEKLFVQRQEKAMAIL